MKKWKNAFWSITSVINLRADTEGNKCTAKQIRGTIFKNSFKEKIPFWFKADLLDYYLTLNILLGSEIYSQMKQLA